jgi:hypothetical protein
MRTLGLILLIIGRLIAYIPIALANSLGFGFTKKFVIAGRVIDRPQNFNTKSYKAAFEIVGRYITDALVRDEMISFRESYLKRDDFWRYNKIAPLHIWAEVLEFFAKKGCIRQYWALGLPDDKEGNINFYGSPYWDANGNRLERPRQSVITGIIPSDVFYPGMLTDEQKFQILENGLYADGPNDCREKTILLPITEANFEKVYYRDRSVLSDQNIEKGSKVLREILKN